MTRALKLQDFGVPDEVPAPADPAPAVLGDADPGGLEAFEQGYKSGWDDCIANETEERRRIGADLAKSLHDVAFSADSVRDEILDALVPLLEQIAAQLLPALAAEALVPLVVSELREIAAAQCAAEAQLVAAPATLPLIENLVAATPGLEVALVPESAYAEGQVSIRFDGRRRELDLSDAAERMSQAIRHFTAEMMRFEDPADGQVRAASAQEAGAA